MTKKISIITLGCAKNDNDTENLSGLLSKRGYGLEKDPAKADAIVVHTCSFIEAAKKESVQTIMEAAQLKSAGKQLIVTGCMVQQHGKEMMEELPEVDAFLGTGQLSQVADLLDKPRARFLDRTNPGGLTDPDAPRILESKGPTATLRLSEGCSHPCSFCVIPKLRGGLQSRSEKTILNEARVLADQGIEEFVIIGQDTGDWGRDQTGQRHLHKLLDQLRTVKGIRWIRLMYMHPVSMTPDLLSVLAESPEIFPYLDMPLQHIDDQMLKEMNRLLGENALRELVSRIRQKAPELTLRTTFIVGHPGETAAQHEKLVQFVRDGHFDYLGAFTYSQEENTPSAVRKDQIDSEIKTERHQELMDAYFESAREKGEKRIGSVETVLIEETEGDHALGRTKREAPEIDAIVRLPKKSVRQGRFVQAKITGYDSFEFTAE